MAATSCPGAFSRVEIWHSASYPKLIVAAIRGDLPLDITGVVMINSHEREVFANAMINILLLCDVSRVLIMDRFLMPIGRHGRGTPPACSCMNLVSVSKSIGLW